MSNKCCLRSCRFCQPSSQQCNFLEYLFNYYTFLIIVSSTKKYFFFNLSLFFLFYSLLLIFGIAKGAKSYETSIEKKIKFFIEID